MFYWEVKGVGGSSRHTHNNIPGNVLAPSITLHHFRSLATCFALYTPGRTLPETPTQCAQACKKKY